MNTQLAHAIDAVRTANEVAQRLAGRTADEATRAVSVVTDNQVFLRAVTAAEAQVQAALDEVEGPTQTKLDYALSALANARDAWNVTVLSNRADAADYTRQAQRHMPVGRIAEND